MSNRARLVSTLGPRALVCVASLFLLAGATSCKEDKPLKLVDPRLRIAADLPDDWGVESTLCSVRDASSKSGLKGLDNCFGWQLGVKDEKGRVSLITERMRLFAVPKAQVDNYDKNKWDKDAVKMSVKTADHVLFAATSKPSDAGVQRVMGSLKHQP